MSATTPVNTVSIDVLRASANGDLTGTLPSGLLVNNRAAGKGSYACITNHGAAGFDPDIGHAALVTNRAATLQNIVTLARTQGLSGINLDFEGLYPADRAAYSSFVADLAAQLHAIASKLILSVPPKQADTASNTWTWPYDFASIGQSADFIQVMTYDQHFTGSAPGPVAGIDWMQTVLQYATSVVPASKVLLGLPAYGYDWNRTATLVCPWLSRTCRPSLLQRMLCHSGTPSTSPPTSTTSRATAAPMKSGTKRRKDFKPRRNWPTRSAWPACQSGCWAAKTRASGRASLPRRKSGGR